MDLVHRPSNDSQLLGLSDRRHALFTLVAAVLTEATDHFFAGLIVDEFGYLKGDADDRYHLREDFIRSSLQNRNWHTAESCALTLSGQLLPALSSNLNPVSPRWGLGFLAASLCLLGGTHLRGHLRPATS